MSDFEKSNKRTARIKKLVLAALFGALSYVAMFATSWIRVGFLTFDAKDTVVTLAGLLLGPLYSLVISLVVSLIEIITIPDTGFWGFLMNFLSTAAFSCSCALIYKYKKSMKGAIIGLVAAVFSTTALMVVLNLLVTPIYTGYPVSAIASMIPTVFLPFNLTKAVLNAALVLMIYKPISRALKAAHLTGVTVDSDAKAGAVISKKSRIITNIAVYATGIVLIAASVAVFILVLGGEFSFGA